MRHALVRLHRIAGLAMALFLVVTAVTGALLAWYHEIDVWLNPSMLAVQPPAPHSQPMDPLVLREMVAERYPHARVHHTPLVHEPGRAAVFFLQPALASNGQPAQTLVKDEVYVDPYTGWWLGDRRWGAFDEGWRNLMPMVYRLHIDLALGSFGHHLLGVVALVWTLDCFVGAWLTLPARAESTRRGRGVSGTLAHAAPVWRRWRRAWSLRRDASRFTLAFDLHRAGSLWTWGLLFVFAWSSVAFNLEEVYEPVMRAMFDSQAAQSAPVHPAPAQTFRDVRTPAEPMSWPEALETGRRHMAAIAERTGLVVVREHRLSYDARRERYTYRVGSDRDIRARRVATLVTFDARTGALLSHYLPTGAATGDTLTTWFVSLHLGDLGSRAVQVLVMVVGLMVVAVTGTGVYIWWRKRHARAHASRAFRAGIK